MTDEGTPQKEAEPRLIATYEIEGTPLYDAQGHAVAVVEDLVIDAAEGDVRYALVMPKGGGELKPVPWEQLSFDTEKQGYVTTTTAEMLERGPSVAPGTVIDWTDESWNARVRSYYATATEN